MKFEGRTIIEGEYFDVVRQNNGLHYLRYKDRDIWLYLAVDGDWLDPRHVSLELHRLTKCCDATTFHRGESNTFCDYCLNRVEPTLPTVDYYVYPNPQDEVFLELWLDAFNDNVLIQCVIVSSLENVLEVFLKDWLGPKPPIVDELSLNH